MARRGAGPSPEPALLRAVVNPLVQSGDGAGRVEARAPRAPDSGSGGGAGGSVPGVFITEVGYFAADKRVGGWRLI